MTYDAKDYWCECISEACEEAELKATPEQIAVLAENVRGAHENYGMAFYSPPSREPGEIKRLEDELRKERSKVACPECSGRGRLQYYAGPWAVDTGCSTCNGEGKVLP